MPRLIRSLTCCRALVEGMAPVAEGVLVGLAASLGATWVRQVQLVGISPCEPMTLSLAPLILMWVALLGCLVPIRQGCE